MSYGVIKCLSCKAYQWQVLPSISELETDSHEINCAPKNEGRRRSRGTSFSKEVVLKGC